jgi:hypothetical protein
MRRSSSGSGDSIEARGDLGPERPPPASRKWYQFGVWVWFPAALLVSLVMGALAGMIHGDRPGARVPRDFFILMAAALPLGMVVVMSLLRRLSGAASKGRREAAGKGRRD